MKDTYKPPVRLHRDGDKWYRVKDGKYVEATDINTMMENLKHGILTHDQKMEMQAGEVEDD